MISEYGVFGVFPCFSVYGHFNHCLFHNDPLHRLIYLYSCPIFRTAMCFTIHFSETDNLIPSRYIFMNTSTFCDPLLQNSIWIFHTGAGCLKRRECLIQFLLHSFRKNILRTVMSGIYDCQTICHSINGSMIINISCHIYIRTRRPLHHRSYSFRFLYRSPQSRSSDPDHRKPAHPEDDCILLHIFQTHQES